MTYQPKDYGSPEINRELNTLAAWLDDDPPIWWWLSFVDIRNGDDDVFLGVCIVEAPNEPMACAAAWEHGCNPGGSVALWPWPSDNPPPEGVRNRLLTKDEALAIQDPS